MSLTRDQLRAARVLLHLQQTQLADIARIGVATIRRFEGGRDIGQLYLDALRRALVAAGAVLIDGDAGGDVPSGAVGVVLKPEGKLPKATRARIAADKAPADASVNRTVSAQTPSLPAQSEAEPKRSDGRARRAKAPPTPPAAQKAERKEGRRPKKG